MNATLQGVSSDVIIIKATTTELKEVISYVQARLNKAENSISHVEDSMNHLTDDTERMAKLVDELWNKAKDLENCSRWNNIKIISLKEGKEAG